MPVSRMGLMTADNHAFGVKVVYIQCLLVVIVVVGQ